MIKTQIFKDRPNLWKALAQKGMVLEQRPPDASRGASKQEELVTEVDCSFDFGKHDGTKWGDTPQTYRDWMIREGVWKSRPKLGAALADAGLVEQASKSTKDYLDNG